MTTSTADRVLAPTLLRARPRFHGSERSSAVEASRPRAADATAVRAMPDPGPALAGPRPGGTPAAVPAGGPVGCCTALSPPTGCPTDPTGCADDAWVEVVMDCLRTVPQPAGMTFGTEILADARREVADEVTTTRRTWGALPPPRRTMPRFLGLLGDVCRTRAAELEVEYRFNVVFANVAGEPQWGTTPPWSDVVAALEAIPAEHLSQRPGRATPVIFRRRALSPRDLAAGTRQIGGEAIDARGEIEIYDPGVRTAPYGRSAAIGIAGTAQTLRHEVGHTVDALVPPADREHFKANVVGWIDYARHWITRGRPSPTCDPSATGLARQGCQLCTALGFVTDGGCDDARLDAFIAGLASGPQTRGGRQYTLGDHFLASVPVDRVPQLREFEYARDDFGEYIAEIYAFALSVPQWLHRVLPAAQVDWLKRQVFDTSRHISEVSASLALGEPYASQFLAEARYVFTRRQLLTVVDQVLARMAFERRHPGGLSRCPDPTAL